MWIREWFCHYTGFLFPCFPCMWESITHVLYSCTHTHMYIHTQAESSCKRSNILSHKQIKPSVSQRFATIDQHAHSMTAGDAPIWPEKAWRCRPSMWQTLVEPWHSINTDGGTTAGSVALGKSRRQVRWERGCSLCNSPSALHNYRWDDSGWGWRGCQGGWGGGILGGWVGGVDIREGM